MKLQASGSLLRLPECCADCLDLLPGLQHPKRKLALNPGWREIADRVAGVVGQLARPGWYVVLAAPGGLTERLRAEGCQADRRSRMIRVWHQLTNAGLWLHRGAYLPEHAIN